MWWRWRALVACLAAWLASSAAGAAGARRAGPRYAFYRDMPRPEGAGGTRRVFGGAAAALRECPGACALLDRYWAARCSGAVLAPRWALTAAHCVSPRLAYVKYNTRRPAAPSGDGGGDAAAVLYLYRHPEYRVVQEDEGRGPDVTLLHHDVGLVRTRADMLVSSGEVGGALASLRRYSPVQLHRREVQALGFGRTERGAAGEELFSVRLTLVFCERGAWFHCVCGAGGGAGGGGVCSGDSGGPVLYRGAQVGVTSMGPLECAEGAAGAAGATGATSVFTALYPYAALLNATVLGADAALHMRELAGAAVVSCGSKLLLVTYLLIFWILSIFN